MSLVSTAPKVTSPTGWNRTPSKRRTPLEVVSQRYPSGDCWMSKTAPRPFSDAHLLWWKLAAGGIGPARAPLWDSSSRIRNAPASPRDLLKTVHMARLSRIHSLVRPPRYYHNGNKYRANPTVAEASYTSFEVRLPEAGISVASRVHPAN